MLCCYKAEWGLGMEEDEKGERVYDIYIEVDWKQVYSQELNTIDGRWGQPPHDEESKSESASRESSSSRRSFGSNADAIP